MLARRLATILPATRLAEALETTRIHSVAGLTGGRTAFVTMRPFRAPHHTISDVGVIGGGQLSTPGDVSRAHHGVLCLDELPEFRRHVLEALRQPLEQRVTSRQSRRPPSPPCSTRPGGVHTDGYGRVRALLESHHDMRHAGIGAQREAHQCASRWSRRSMRSPEISSVVATLWIARGLIIGFGLREGLWRGMPQRLMRALFGLVMKGLVWKHGGKEIVKLTLPAYSCSGGTPWLRHCSLTPCMSC
jgi:Magnesium chelatase, subunit ChlI